MDLEPQKLRKAREWHTKNYHKTEQRIKPKEKSGET
jgi:hypothetical protein